MQAVQVRAFLAWVPLATSLVDEGCPTIDATGEAWTAFNAPSLRIRYIPRTGAASGRQVDVLPDLYLGDGADLDTRNFVSSVGTAVPIRYDAVAQTLALATSLVGMPPVFIYRGSNVIAVASNVHLLRGVPGVELELDPQGVIELGSIGHPVQHRTLFQNLTIADSGARISLDASGRLTTTSAWELPHTAPLPWSQFIEAQIASFESALGRMDLNGSFLSLTGGLDTRAVFSGLAAQRRLVPAATMTGRKLSTDAQIAQRLCNEYGVQHRLITYDADFTSRLPGYVERASLLTGGLSTLEQSTEVYFYHQLNGIRARISGNLGNQVGRGGTEGYSVRDAKLDILGDRFKSTVESGGSSRHWLLDNLHRGPREKLQYVLQNEAVFTSVGNYSLGNFFAAQQSPYATRELIESLAYRPEHGGPAPSDSLMRSRFNDLKHRFVGEREERSFQRTLVKRNGGFAAACPVNWGWRPSGGLSPRYLGLGILTLFGMYARAKGLDEGASVLNRTLARLATLHGFRAYRRWLRRNLRDYVHDLIEARPIKDAGLFDKEKIRRVLSDHFSDRVNAYNTVVYTIDLALAYRNFTEANALAQANRA